MGRRPALRALPRSAPRKRTLAIASALLALLCVPALAQQAEPLPRPSGETSAPLTLETAVSLALERSPRLGALAREISARSGAAAQASLRPNPELRAELEDFGGSDAQSGFDSAQATVLLVQPVETAGKRHRRSELADHSRAIAIVELQAARADVAAEAKRAFFTALSLQQRLALAEERVRLAEESVAAVNALVEAGGAPPIETLQVRVELATVQVARTELARRFEAARVDLAATWASREAAFGDLSGDLGPTLEPPPREALFARLARSPQLARWDAERAERRAALALEQAARVPDVSVGIGARRFAATDSNAVVAEVSLPLPIFARNQGGIEEARARVEKLDFERSAAEIEAHASLASAHQALSAAHARATSLESEIIPLADEAYRGARRGYRQGFFRFTDVLDAQRTLFELRDSRFEALEAYHLARTEIERWLGGSLEVAP